MPNYYFNSPVHQGSQILVQPAVEPVCLADAKLQSRVDADITSEDGLITRLITVARRECEALTQRAFITQTWFHTLDTFPFWRTYSPFGPAIELVKPPVQSVTSVQYLDQNLDQQTLDSSFYTLDNISEPARLVKNSIQIWPVVGFAANAVQITTVNGYGDDPSDVPAGIQQAILVYVAWMYRNRGDEDAATTMPPAVVNLLAPFVYGGVW